MIARALPPALPPVIARAVVPAPVIAHALQPVHVSVTVTARAVVPVNVTAHCAPVIAPHVMRAPATAPTVRSVQSALTVPIVPCATVPCATVPALSAPVTAGANAPPAHATAPVPVPVIVDTYAPVALIAQAPVRAIAPPAFPVSIDSNQQELRIWQDSGFQGSGDFREACFYWWEQGSLINGSWVMRNCSLALWQPPWHTGTIGHSTHVFGTSSVHSLNFLFDHILLKGLVLTFPKDCREKGQALTLP